MLCMFLYTLLHWIVPCPYYFFHSRQVQKQPPKVFYRKRCSQKFRKIHRKTPVPESLFYNLLYLQKIWNNRWIHFLIECSFLLRRFFTELIPLCKKCSYSVFSGLFFAAFGLNTEIYSVNLRVHYNFGKIQTRKNFVSI